MKAVVIENKRKLYYRNYYHYLFFYVQAESEAAQSDLRLLDQVPTSSQKQRSIFIVNKC